MPASGPRKLTEKSMTSVFLVELPDSTDSWNALNPSRQILKADEAGEEISQSVVVAKDSPKRDRLGNEVNEHRQELGAHTLRTGDQLINVCEHGAPGDKRYRQRYHVEIVERSGRSANVTAATRIPPPKATMPWYVAPFLRRRWTFLVPAATIPPTNAVKPAIQGKRTT
jgi:hypothetical protein